MLAAALAAAGVQPQAQPAPAVPAEPVPAPEAAPIAEAVSVPAPAPKLVLPKGTMIRLMVTKEVNSRDNHAGDRFALRVDEDVKADGLTLIPIGAKAWGEVTAAQGTGGAGKSGKIGARLLYVEAAGQRIDLDGERQSAGSGGTGQVVGAVVAFGIFGLFAKGNNASIKAGEIINGYTLSDAAFDPPAPKPL
jgi:hypothetical protein